MITIIIGYEIENIIYPNLHRKLLPFMVDQVAGLRSFLGLAVVTVDVIPKLTNRHFTSDSHFDSNQLTQYLLRLQDEA